MVWVSQLQRNITIPYHFWFCIPIVWSWLYMTKTSNEKKSICFIWSNHRLYWGLNLIKYNPSKEQVNFVDVLLFSWYIFHAWDNNKKRGKLNFFESWISHFYVFSLTRNKMAKIDLSPSGEAIKDNQID